MNTDDFEQRLREKAMRTIPDSWRDEILEAARTAASSRPTPRTPQPSSWWRELLWPCPQAWAALATLWLAIFAIQALSPDASSEVVEARSSHLSAEMLAVVSEHRLLLAELIDPSPEEPAKAAPPKRRSERRVDCVAV